MRIKSSNHSYEVNFMGLEETLTPFEPGNTWIITDDNVAGAYKGLLDRFPNVRSVTPGESSKSMKAYESCLSWMVRSGAKRKSTVVALGGGVIGDLAGFVAATYMRGVDLVMVPTSLLAMVDSSVGGKVGIDLPEGKNLVGSFWPPREVRIAVSFLETLPEREFVCGTAEVVKYGAIMDPELFEGLRLARLRQSDRLEAVVASCIGHKAHVVEADEYETTGIRAILNYGHTVGHALETILGYGAWTHGEAISVGMLYEAKLGEEMGVTQPGTSVQLEDVLRGQGLPTELPNDLNVDLMVDLMKNDKKATVEGMSFSLLTGIGRCKLVSGVSENLVRQVLRSE